MNNNKKPKDLLTCEVCKQQPESLAFDVSQCILKCPFKSAKT